MVEGTITERAIEVEADSLEEAKRSLRAQVPERLVLLSEDVVSNGRPKAVKATAATVEAALEKARAKVPEGAEVLETEVLMEPGDTVVPVEAFSEEDAGTFAKAKPGGTRVRAVRLVSHSRKRFLWREETPNRYEVDVTQQAVVRLKHSTRAKVKARIGRSPKDQLAAAAEAWGSVPSGTSEICDNCGDKLHPSWGWSTTRIPNADFKKLVELGYDPTTGRARALVSRSGHSPADWYARWKVMVLAESTDWGLCEHCAADIREFIAAA